MGHDYLLSGGFLGAANLYFSCVDVRDVASLHRGDARFVIRLVALFDGDAKTATNLLDHVHHCDSSRAIDLLA